MIRINLLPTRDAPRRQAAVVQIVVFLVIVAVAAIAFVTIDMMQSDQIQDQERDNAVISSRIKRIQTHIEDHDQIRERIDEIESKQGVINRLQARRTGPVFVLSEMSKILSRNGTPSFDHDWYMDLVRHSPGQAYDPDWDGRRLWINTFTEEERQVDLSGEAMSHEDVAEFLRRLALSDFFHEVTLVTTQTNEDSTQENYVGPALVQFEIRCRLRYGGRPMPVKTDEAQAEPEKNAGKQS